MILATGQRSRGLRRCAFTLIELILVLALLVVAVSMVAPRMSSFVRGRALDSEARRLAAVMHAGKARAVSEGMTMVLWVDEKQNRYGLEQETPLGDADSRAENFMTDPNVNLAVLNAGAAASTLFKDLPAIRFLADGMVDEGSPRALKLQDSGGGSLWLVTAQDRTGYEIRNQYD
jgi:type II secretion system protein H